MEVDRADFCGMRRVCLSSSVSVCVWFDFVLSLFASVIELGLWDASRSAISTFHTRTHARTTHASMDARGDGVGHHDYAVSWVVGWI